MMYNAEGIEFVSLAEKEFVALANRRSNCHLPLPEWGYGEGGVRLFTEPDTWQVKRPQSQVAARKVQT